MKNILISRFYEQFSRNGSAMAPEQMFKKISNFKIMNILYIILKHVVWRFRIYNYFHEIFKFRENMSKNKFREISLSVHKIHKSDTVGRDVPSIVILPMRLLWRESIT